MASVIKEDEEVSLIALHDLPPSPTPRRDSHLGQLHTAARAAARDSDSDDFILFFSSCPDLAAALLCALIHLIFLPPTSQTPTLDQLKMPYTHIVSFKYRSDVDAAKRQEAYDRFLQLKPSCETKEGKPYILDLKAGKGNVSPEGKGHGYDVSPAQTRLCARSHP